MRVDLSNDPPLVVAVDGVPQDERTILYVNADARRGLWVSLMHDGAERVLDSAQIYLDGTLALTIEQGRYIRPEASRHADPDDPASP